jgi:ankyrin repeat protein
MQVDSWTALHIAAANGHTDVVKALLAAGANVSATRTVRVLVWRPASLAMKPGRVPWDVVAARDARDVSGGHVSWGRCVSKRSPFPSVVCSAVVYSAPWYHDFRCGCLPLMQVDGQTALHMAVLYSHTDTVKALLAAGANVSATAVRGLLCGGLQRTRDVLVSGLHSGLVVWP